jgi:hypothetical protein
MNQKVSYLLRSIRNFFQKKKCPNCKGTKAIKVDQKFIFTKLLKCQNCKLNYRFPVDEDGLFDGFYQEEYKNNNVDVPLIINELPSDIDLNSMMDNNFPTQRDHSSFIYALLKNYDRKVTDFGSSWGYSVFQLKNAGFDAEGFEISKPRAVFGTQKLGVNINYDESAVRQDNDLIMSNHAIEHIPKVQNFINLTSSKLKENGIFMSFCPNGSLEYRRREPDSFHLTWGFLHPNYLDVDFAIETFKHNPYLILTGDCNYDLKTLFEWDGQSQIIGENRSGRELLMISKPNIHLKKINIKRMSNNKSF